MTDARPGSPTADPESIHAKLNRIENRITVIETRLSVWQNMVIPMMTGFVGVVAGILLAVFAVKG